PAAELRGFGIGTVLEAGPGHVQFYVVGPGAVQLVVDDAARAVLRGLQHHGRAGVAEQHHQVTEARVPLELLRRGRDVRHAARVVEVRARPGHEADVHLRAHQQHGLGHARPDLRVGELQPVEEAGALLADVEAGTAPRAGLVLPRGGRTREG